MNILWQGKVEHMEGDWNGNSANGYGGRVIPACSGGGNKNVEPEGSVFISGQGYVCAIGQRPERIRIRACPAQAVCCLADRHILDQVQFSDNS